MNLEAKADGDTGECRALVPLTVPAGRALRACPRANAAFVTQLAANVNGLPPYRAKRRANPATGVNAYRASVSRALASASSGRKLNYIA